MGLKVFSASYYETGPWGYWKDGDAVVVANTETEALGMLLQEDSDTKANYWSLEEIDTNKAGVSDMGMTSSS